LPAPLTFSTSSPIYKSPANKLLKDL